MERIEELFSAAPCPSVAYGVSLGSEILICDATGEAVPGTPATPQTPYALASITKPLTATALMILVEHGQVDLREPINRYLPVGITSRAADASGATIERVANHTAGLPLHYQFFYEDEPFRRPPVDETIRRYAKTFWPPGERYLYSNLGYGLLDHLIELVSGTSYPEFMAREVFEALGMQHASIGATSGAAVGYGEGFAYPRYTFDHPGGSAAFASVEDLLKFGQFHLGLRPGPLSRASLSEMQMGSAWVDESSQYGLGWSIAERLGRTVIQHSGSMGGVRTMLRLIPSLEAVIVILTNGEDDFPFHAVAGVQAALDPPAQELLAATRKLEPPAKSREEFPVALRKLFSGRVETHAGDLPFALDLASGFAVLVGIESEISDLRLQDGYVRGVFDGDGQAEDASRRPYRLHIDLRATEDGLQGAVSAITERCENRRTGNALSYWAQLAGDRESPAGAHQTGA